MSFKIFLQKMGQPENAGARFWLLFAGLLLALVLAMAVHDVHVLAVNRQRLVQETEMQEVIDSWHEKAVRLNGAYERPVTEEQSLDVQRRLLFAMQGNGLSLQSLQMSKEKHGQVYDVDVSGTWPQVIHLLQGFHVDDALLAVKSLKMSSHDGQIQAHLTYKIYTK